MLKKMIWMFGTILITISTIVFSEWGGIIGNPIGPIQTPIVEWTATAFATATEGIPSNPFATPTVNPVNTLQPTPTKTATQAPAATFTKTSTSAPVEPTKTNTAVPPKATNTATVVPPTPTKIVTSVPPTPTKTLVPFKIQPSSPVYLSNFAHPDDGCAWQGVAGQVFDERGDPVSNLIVKVTGYWDGKQVSLIGVTGMVSGKPYGPGSFEIILGAKALDTVDSLKIQVLNTDLYPLTYGFKFSTSSNCDKNLVIFNFKHR